MSEPMSVERARDLTAAFLARDSAVEVSADELAQAQACLRQETSRLHRLDGTNPVVVSVDEADVFRSAPPTT